MTDIEKPEKFNKDTQPLMSEIITEAILSAYARNPGWKVESIFINYGTFVKLYEEFPSVIHDRFFIPEHDDLGAIPFILENDVPSYILNFAIIGDMNHG